MNIVVERANKSTGLKAHTSCSSNSLKVSLVRQQPKIYYRSMITHASQRHPWRIKVAKPSHAGHLQSHPISLVNTIARPLIRATTVTCAHLHDQTKETSTSPTTPIQRLIATTVAATLVLTSSIPCYAEQFTIAEVTPPVVQQGELLNRYVFGGGGWFFACAQIPTCASLNIMIVPFTGSKQSSAYLSGMSTA